MRFKTSHALGFLMLLSVFSSVEAAIGGTIRCIGVLGRGLSASEPPTSQRAFFMSVQAYNPNATGGSPGLNNLRFTRLNAIKSNGVNIGPGILSPNIDLAPKQTYQTNFQPANYIAEALTGLGIELTWSGVDGRQGPVYQAFIVMENPSDRTILGVTPAECSEITTITLPTG